MSTVEYYIQALVAHKKSDPPEEEPVTLTVTYEQRPADEQVMELSDEDAKRLVEASFPDYVVTCIEDCVEM